MNSLVRGNLFRDSVWFSESVTASFPSTLAFWALKHFKCVLFLNQGITEYKALKAIHNSFIVKFLGCIVVLLLATFLHLITVFIVNKMHLLKTVQLCLLMLAIIDIISLVLGPGEDLVYHWLLYDIAGISNWLHYTNIYISRLIKQFQVWVIQYLTFSRCKAILAHTVVLQNNKKKYEVIKMSVSLFLLLALLNSPILWLPKLTVCYVPKQFYLDRYFTEVTNWIHFILALCIPCAIITVSNLAIAVKISYVSFIKRKVGISSQNEHIRTLVSKSNVILLLSSLFYVLCTIPDGIVEYVGIRSTPSRLNITVFLPLATLLYYLNNSIHFFMYCLSAPEFHKYMCQCRVPVWRRANSSTS